VWRIGQGIDGKETEAAVNIGSTPEERSEKHVSEWHDVCAEKQMDSQQLGLAAWGAYERRFAGDLILRERTALAFYRWVN
jgi:hypothetical protein